MGDIERTEIRQELVTLGKTVAALVAEVSWLRREVADAVKTMVTGAVCDERSSGIKGRIEKLEGGEKTETAGKESDRRWLIREAIRGAIWITVALLVGGQIKP